RGRRHRAACLRIYDRGSRVGARASWHKLRLGDDGWAGLCFARASAGRGLEFAVGRLGSAGGRGARLAAAGLGSALATDRSPGGASASAEFRGAPVRPGSADPSAVLGGGDLGSGSTTAEESGKAWRKDREPATDRPGSVAHLRRAG